jgi:RNA polymerase sigma-70 factor (ECF subfamily)
MTAAPHLPGDDVPSSLSVRVSRPVAPAVTGSPSVAVELGRAIDEHFDGLWRFARRLGVPEADVDDVLQEVIVILAQRLSSVDRPKRKSFLFSTTFRVASELRRKSWNTREVARADDAPEPASLAAGPDDLLDDARARALLERVLDSLPLDVRAVFVLYEIEEHTMSEIAALLDLPAGTVASRLRRARAHFEGEVARLAVQQKEKTR